MDANTFHAQDILATARQRISWDVDTDLPAMTLNHAWNAEHHVPAGPNEWSIHRETHLWLELPDVTLVAQRWLPSDASEEDEVDATVAMIHEAQAFFSDTAARKAQRRLDLRRLMAALAGLEPSGRLKYRDQSVLLEVIRRTHDESPASREELASILEHALRTNVNASTPPGIAGPEWPAEQAQKWIEQALAADPREEKGGWNVNEDLIDAMDALPTLREAELAQTSREVRAAAEAAEAAQVRRRDAIREALAAGMTQAQVAHATGVTQGRIAQIARSTSSSMPVDAQRPWGAAAGDETRS